MDKPLGNPKSPKMEVVLCLTKPAQEFTKQSSAFVDAGHVESLHAMLNLCNENMKVRKVCPSRLIHSKLRGACATIGAQVP